jgi:signal transduction histidine kinase
MLVAVVLALVGVLTFYFIADSVLQDSSTLASGELSDSLKQRFVYGGLIFTGLAFLTGALLGRTISRPLRTLRAELSDLLRGDRADTSTRSPIQEIDRLSTALDSLIRELHAQQRQLDQERNELTSLLESGTEGLLQVNELGRIVHVNSAASDLLGLPPNARGQSITTLIRQADLRDLILTSVDGTTSAPCELDVDDRHLLVVCRALPNGGAVVAIMDLTEVRRLEAVRRDFVANVSHELKTPLTSIRGYAETLLADDLPRELRLQFLDVIQKNTARIHRIVDDLLDLSRLQSGGWRPEIQDVDVAELAEDVWAGCQAAAKKDIAFDLAASGSTHVSADPAGVRQILANLFDNALRYTPEGGRVHVRILEQRHRKARNNGNPSIEILVQDTGSGVPRDALPRIFERFYRVDPARSRAEGGTGLGLSIVKHLVERMDGDVAAESELGKGTTIRFRLPAA